MVLGFSERWKGEPTNFVEHVLSGRKWHTVRWGNRWREGMAIQFATGVRTKNYRCFHVGKVAKVQRVKVIPSVPDPERPQTYLPRVLVARGVQQVLQPLCAFELMAFAINDGFDSAYDLNRWFAETCRENNTTAFRGQIIMWEPIIPGTNEPKHY
jgi:hypothetical protein